MNDEESSKEGEEREHEDVARDDTHAKGEMQLERTPNRDISNASDLDKPTIPSFAAA